MNECSHLSQLAHCGALALVLVGFGLIALALDIYATKLAKLGATRDTVTLVRLTAKCLLALDLLVLLAVALYQAGRFLLCYV